MKRGWEKQEQLVHIKNQLVGSIRLRVKNFKREEKKRGN